MNQTAQGLAALGRGPDTQLVHMAPGEVRSLQQLAMAHGGSLTINPQTGLPEAGFLSSLLPMLIGAGLTFATGGAAAPLIAGMGNAATIGLGVGGLQALRTGSLKKGLMAGLGAYGGAGLAGGLMGAGAATTGNAAASGAFDASLGKQGLSAAEAAMDVSNPLAEQAAASARTAATSSNLNNLTAGAKGLTSVEGRNAFMNQIGEAKGLMQTGLAAAAPMMETTTKQPEIKTDKDMGQRYQFNAGTQTPTPTPDVPGYGYQGQNFGREQRYFTPSYEQIDNEAARKMYGFASGGPVENMSNANAIGMNTGYPQADTDTGAYATPYQQPISRNMIPDMQSAQFAGGGSINLQGTFDMGGGQGGGQMGGLNNPQPFVGSNNAPSRMPQQGVTPMPGADFMPGPAVMPRGLQELLKGPMSQGMAFAGGGSVDTSAPQKGLFKNLLPQAGMQGGSNTAVGGYSFDPVTQKYTQNASGAVDPSADPSSNGLIGRLLAQADMQGGSGGYTYNPTTQKFATKEGGESAPAMAQGGISHLGDYSDGGRLLRGPGDGISDSIPAMIGKKQPARLADGEFVVPARIVSELGNGSTEAGARKLYAMMDRVQKARGKTVGKGKVAANSRSSKYLPA
jgi:hypothetical protein